MRKRIRIKSVAGEAGQVVVVGATGDDVAAVAMGLGLLSERLGVNEEPGKWLAIDFLILHLVGEFAIITVDAREVDEAVLVLEDVCRRRLQRR